MLQRLVKQKNEELRERSLNDEREEIPEKKAAGGKMERVELMRSLVEGRGRNAVDDEFDEMDVNHDGVIDRQEWEQYHVQKETPNPRTRYCASPLTLTPTPISHMETQT